MTIRKRIKGLLLERGIKRHLNGFEYLLDCIEIAWHLERTFRIEKDVYYAVALKHKTTRMCIERSARSAIAASGRKIAIKQFIYEIIDEIDADIDF